jgi:ammonia channel protein AmtB
LHPRFTHTHPRFSAQALVQFMTPGLAFFYGGLVGEGAAISTMMMSFAGARIVISCGAFSFEKHLA